MVCNYRDEWEDSVDAVTDEARRKELAELNLTTRLLCDVMKAVTFLENTDNPDLYFHPEKFILETIPDLRQWWIKHQKIDKQRKQS
jgi:hypothetical protein